MSAEFMTEYSDSTIKAAVENMSETMRGIGDIADYIEAIQESYFALAHGESELNQMLYAAQQIVNRDTDDYGDEVQAVYRGELIGLELVNYLTPDTRIPFKSGYASAYVEKQLDVNRAKDSMNPQFERFNEKIAQKLTDNRDHQLLAMEGFRMIITEALNPITDNTTNEALEQLVGDFESDDPEWEDVNYVRANIARKFKQLVEPYKDLDKDAPRNDPDIRRLLMSQLERFNHSNDLLRTNHLLSVTGELFIIVKSDGDTDIYQTDQYMEYSGFYGGIVVTEAPSNKQLLRSLNDTDESEFIADTLTAAIRIYNPTITENMGEGQINIEPTSNTCIDIPLIYKNIQMKRIDTANLENDR